VTDFSGGENYIFGEEIIASNVPVHQDFLAVIREKFNAP